MIKELLNDFKRLEEQLVQNKKEEDEILALLGSRAIELLRAEWNDGVVKKEIEDLNAVFEIHVKDSVLLEDCIKFVKSEKPTDEEFEQFWRTAVKKRISKILEGTG